jgi:hypothetical protein
MHVIILNENVVPVGCGGCCLDNVSSEAPSARSIAGSGGIDQQQPDDSGLGSRPHMPRFGLGRF